ncbi:MULTISPECIES: hypothetical protein [unclassified Streptomyces]|nr:MULTISPECIES: hypothetical protein [unclassified Streptomyces]QZZ28348.1 hypothetical protein A7X85_20570 [Streptomyces sp. ST1015]
MALAAFAVWMPTLVSVAWMTLVVGLGVLALPVPVGVVMWTAVMLG